MLIPCLAHIEDVKIRGWPRAQPVPPKNHDAGLVNVLAPWRNAAIAAEVLSRQSSMCTTSNHTNPSSPYVPNARKQVGDLRWLACRGCRTGFGEEYRITRHLPHGNDGRPEQGSELVGRAVVVAVDTYPGHVRLAGPPVLNRAV